MIEAPEPDCWLHPDLEVRASPIEGRGLFARSPIPAGTVVSRVGGRLVTWPQLQDLFAAAAQDPAHPYIDTITVSDDQHLVLPPRHPVGYGNHSCDPNLWWIDAYTLAARQDIATDEEATNDYGTSSGVSNFLMPCACRSPLCRGTITGDDWRRPDLQDRYQGHWIPILARRIQLT